MARHKRLSSLEMIERLIGFDTTSKHSNLEFIAFVEDYLRSWGVASERIVCEDGRKANLWASLGRKDVGGGIILSGHSDVVPVEGQNWSSDPFRAKIREGRLYGRGACDMKSFIAIALAMVPDFLERSLRTPVHFAISYDEEVGCVGARSLISHIRSHLSFSPATPLLAIIGEPSSMQVVNAHKSANLFETNIKGLEAHSSAPLKGVNAILAAGRLLCFLEDVGFEMRKRNAGENGFAERFDPPWTSVQVGEISGGTAINIIPKECWFNWEYRCLPGSDEEEIFHRFCVFAEEQVLPDMRSISQNTDITTRRLASVPSFSAGENSEAEALALRLSGGNQSYAIAGATEAGLFESAGFSAIICGPGSVLQAHRPDEFITLEQIKECEKFLERLLEYLRA